MHEHESNLKAFESLNLSTSRAQYGYPQMLAVETKPGLLLGKTLSAAFPKHLPFALETTWSLCSVEQTRR
jgi:hypothetical protein